ncbi:MAG: MFS transporter [Planctomycetota bacterium]
MRKSALGVLFLTVFIDLLGFGIVIPLLPRYARDFRASGVEIGLVLASFSAMQFLFAPFWGRLSDAYGRRRLILLGLFGSVVSYLLFAIADTYALLLVSRILAGIFAATIGTAQAYIADVTGREDRGKGMALIGAAFGVGFTFGPVIGWLAHDFGGSAGPGLAAAGLSALALLLAWFKLPEPERHRAPRAGGLFGGAALRWATARPSVALILGLYVLTTFCFANFEGTLALLTKDKWGHGIRGNGLLFTYIGVCLLISQGVLVRRLMPRVGERNFTRMGSVLLACGLAGIAVGGSRLAWVLFVLAVSVLGFAMITPSLTSLLSLHTPDHMQGEVLGVGQSGLSLARIFGPFLGNVLFAVWWEAPYWLGAGLMVLAFGGALLLRPAPDHGA